MTHRQRIAQELHAGPRTLDELTAAVGCSRSTVERFIRAAGELLTYTQEHGAAPRVWRMRENPDYDEITLEHWERMVPAPARPGRRPALRDVLARYLYEHPRSRTVDAAFACTISEPVARRTLHAWPSWFIPERGFRHIRWRLTPAQNEAQRDQAAREGWR